MCAGPFSEKGFQKVGDMIRVWLFCGMRFSKKWGQDLLLVFSREGFWKSRAWDLCWICLRRGLSQSGLQDLRKPQVNNRLRKYAPVRFSLISDLHLPINFCVRAKAVDILDLRRP